MTEKDYRFGPFGSAATEMQDLIRERDALRFEIGSLQEQHRILGECYAEATAARDALRERLDLVREDRDELIEAIEDLAEFNRRRQARRRDD